MAKRNMLSSEEFYQSEMQRFRRMYPTLPDSVLKDWAKDRQNRRERFSGLRRAERAAAIAMLGSACARCGQDDNSLLEIDHVVPVLGKRDGSTASEVLKANGEGFQLLCTPCHKDKTRDDMRLIRQIA